MSHLINSKYFFISIVGATFGLFVLSILGFNIPFIYQIVIGIFLIFIPGLLILKIFRIHSITPIERIVYSVSVSIAFLIFSGLFINTVLPLFGIAKPISFYPLVSVISIFVIILGIIAYIRDRHSSSGNMPQFNISKYSLAGILFLILLPILAILGALFISVYSNPIILLILIILIAAVVILVTFNLLGKNLYSLAISMIAISLLFQVTLASPQLQGYDIHIEYYLQNLVIQNGYWNSNIAQDYNTALSVTLLCPTYSLLLDMSSIWVLKIIYPLLFSLVPLALFQIFRGQIGAKKAFFAVFFFMAMNTFFLEITALARQQIAELFLVALILILVNRSLSVLQKSILAIIFVVSLPVSHYGLAYITIGLFGIGLIVLWLLSNNRIASLWGKIAKTKTDIKTLLDIPRHSTLTGALVVLFLLIVFAWYFYTAGGIAFHTVVGIGNAIYSNLQNFLEPTSRQSTVNTAIGLGFGSSSNFGKAFLILQYFTEFSIIIGFISFIIKPQNYKFKAEFFALAFGAMFLLAATVLLPVFSATLNATRLYHISLLLLSSFFIIGAENIFKGICSLFRHIIRRLRINFNSLTPDWEYASLILVAVIILIPYFFFTSGFVYEVTKSTSSGDIPGNRLSLSSYRVDAPVFNDAEAAAVNYTKVFATINTPIYADGYGTLLLYDQYDQLSPVTKTINGSGLISDNAYLFLRTWNIKNQEVLVTTYHGVQGISNYLSSTKLDIINDNLVYDNNEAQILATK